MTAISHDHRCELHVRCTPYAGLSSPSLSKIPAGGARRRFLLALPTSVTPQVVLSKKPAEPVEAEEDHEAGERNDRYQVEQEGRVLCPVEEGKSRANHQAEEHQRLENRSIDRMKWR